MEEVNEIAIIVKWSGKEFPITDVTDHDTVEVLRHEIFKKTQVRPERQKLLNLKYKGKMAADNIKLNLLELKPNFKLMMVGSTEADIEGVCHRPEGADDVVDDFDIETKQKLVSIERGPIYRAKVARRVREYKIKELSPPREGKRLLVLDIDYTLFDHRSSAETGAELMRPYLHEFLESAYEHYDIVVWSATSMRWIEEKMRLLGVSSHSNYKIMFYLDSSAMISVNAPDRGGIIDVKPLAVIWGKYPQYSSKNTIMFDDIRRNLLMNRESGLKVRPFRQAHLNRQSDTELLKLSKYLHDIALHCPDFNDLNHRKWEQYKPPKK